MYHICTCEIHIYPKKPLENNQFPKQQPQCFRSSLLGWAACKKSPNWNKHGFLSWIKSSRSDIVCLPNKPNVLNNRDVFIIPSAWGSLCLIHKFANSSFHDPQMDGDVFQRCFWSIPKCCQGTSHPPGKASRVALSEKGGPGIRRSGKAVKPTTRCYKVWPQNLRYSYSRCLVEITMIVSIGGV